MFGFNYTKRDKNNAKRSCLLFNFHLNLNCFEKNNFWGNKMKEM